MPSADLPAATLGAALARAAASPRGVRFVAADEAATFFTYQQIADRAAAIAGGLRAAGVEAGDSVALVLPTSVDFLGAFFAASWLGAVPVPLYPPVRLGRLEEYHARTAAMLRASRARLVLTDGRIRRLLGEAAWRARVPLGCHAVTELDARLPAERVEPQADAPAFIQFSSGTTSAPKPVVLTHRQVLANVRAILGAIMAAHPEGPELTHAGVSWLPLYHDMGLVGCVLTAVDHPGDLTLIPPELFLARPALWLRTIARYRGTISPAPNFAYALCADRIAEQELAGLDLSCWRVALNGAEPVTPAVLRRFVDRFAPFGLRRETLTPVYGLAEAALAVTFSPVDQPFATARFARQALSEAGVARPAADGVELVNLGRPLAGFALRVVDEQDEPLPAGRLGRVLIRGPSLMDGYLDQPAATAATLRDGWLDSGDLGFVHQGDLFLYGRAKDVIVIRGRNWAPQEIEQVVDEVNGVRRGCSAALGVVERDGEQLVVLVERGRGPAETDLALQVRRRIVARLGLTARVEVLAPGTLPRTSSGKIRRADAGAQLAAGTLSAPAPVGLLRLVRAMAGSSLKLWRLAHGR